MQNEGSCNSCLSNANLMSGKFLVLELFPKMFLTNQYPPKNEGLSLSSFADKCQGILKVEAIAFGGHAQST